MATSSWNSNASRSWRPTNSPVYGSGGWRSEPEVYQGQWESWGLHRGLWFFNDSNIRSTLNGRTITRVRIRLSRLSGGTTAAVNPTIRPHNYGSQPSGAPSFESGTVTNQGWSTGQSRTIDLPVAWGNRFRDNAVKGIGVYTTSNSPYMIFQGSATLTIDHEPTLSPPSTPDTPTVVSVSQTEFTMTTSSPPDTETWEWNPQDAGDNFAVRHTPFYTRPGLPGGSYNVRVRARNSAGVSPYSAYRSVLHIPATPPAPSTGTRTTTSIAQSISALTGATGYDWEVNGVTTITNGSPNVNFTGLSPDTSYNFRVRSRNSSGMSPRSPVRSASTLLPAPGTPSRPTSSELTETSVRVAWDGVSYAENYDLEHNGSIIRSATTSRNHLVSGLQDGADHVFRVRSRNATATSSWSLPLTVTTPSIWSLPSTPTDVGPEGIEASSRPALAAKVADQEEGLEQRVQWQIVPLGTTFTGAPVYTSTFQSSGSFSFQLSANQALEQQGPFRIRARSEHAEGGTSPWSEPEEFFFTRLRVWSGSEWVPRVIRVWDGVEWKKFPLRVRGPSGWM